MQYRPQVRNLKIIVTTRKTPNPTKIVTEELSSKINHIEINQTKKQEISLNKLRMFVRLSGLSLVILTLPVYFLLNHNDSSQHYLRPKLSDLSQTSTKEYIINPYHNTSTCKLTSLPFMSSDLYQCIQFTLKKSLKSLYFLFCILSAKYLSFNHSCKFYPE